MPPQARLTSAAANAQIDAVTALLNGGWLDVYDGTQPASADDRPSGANVLASLQFGSPAFFPGVNGVAIAHPMTPDMDAMRTGTATWYRLTRADHRTGVADGSVGTADANLIMNAVAIQQHAEVAIGAFTLTASRS